MAAAFADIRGPSRAAEVCFGCGKPGHLKRDCPALKEEKPKFIVVCSQCRRGQHFFNQCHSKYDSKGHQRQGNQNWSAEWPCGQTQMPLQMLTPQVPNRGSPQVYA
ncbi:GAK5 protein, partial [Nicator chloris]|nr:GAK5 protein [Nicator chloris]